jgi:intracellular septation protein
VIGFGLGLAITSRYSRPMSASLPVKTAHPPWIKLVLELGPLAIFFVANLRPEWFRPLVSPFAPASLMADSNAGIFIATAVFMVAMIVSLGLFRADLRRPDALAA